MSEALKALGLGDFKGIKTFQSAYDSTYGIIAEAKGLHLSILPKLAAHPFSPFIGIYIRVRAQKAQEWANLSDAASIFGVPELVEKSPDHASIEFYIPVALQGTVLPYMLGKRIIENKLYEKIVDNIADRVQKAGSSLVADRETIVQYINSKLVDNFPTEEPKNITEFPVFVGDENINKGLTAIAVEFGFIPKEAE